jgi:hypothetical protein
MPNLSTSTGASLSGIGQRIMESLRRRKKKPAPVIVKPVAPKEKFGQSFIEGLKARQKALKEF